MSVRYQAVDENECPEGPYFAGSRSDKSPIIYNSFSNDSSWKDLLRLPNEPRKRRLFIATTFAIALFVFFMLSVAVAKITLIKGINDDRANTKYGLQLIPDLRVHKSGSFIYSAYNSPSYNSIKQKYVTEIDKFLDIYWKEQLERQRYMTDCTVYDKPKDKWCRFSAKKHFKTNGECSPRNNYGFDSGEPCLLFAFKDEINWSPDWVNRNTLDYLPFKCEIKTSYNTYGINATYYPSVDAYPAYGGFAMDKIPSSPIKGENGYVVDNDGEILYDLPALVFVKLRRNTHNVKLNFVCSIKDSVEHYQFSNMDAFVGLKDIRFTIETYDEP
ncbi:unnamed protein product, partial [Mesorhabditis spiculigera]